MKDRIRIGIIKSGGLAVITLGDGKFEPWEESEIYQAMTAAVELLGAAKLLIDGAESEGWDCTRGTDEPRTGIAELRAAIAKAEAAE